MQRVRVLRQLGEEAEYVLGVSFGLERRMEFRLPGHVVDQHAARVVVPHLGAAPLLELDDHVRVAAGAPVDAGEHHVRSLAGQRQLVLDEHLDPAEAGGDEVLGDHGEAPFPRPHLGARDGDSVPHLQLLGELPRELLLDG
ncbi:MAG TPA: hypothetical protein VKY91_03880 [Vulgatibacteraceae bacterium]|nr:hypothetical protein [Vulgatibacteraceae bacterium]